MEDGGTMEKRHLEMYPYFVNAMFPLRAKQAPLATSTAHYTYSNNRNAN